MTIEQALAELVCNARETLFSKENVVIREAVETVRVNHNLIAASPELLAALEAVTCNATNEEQDWIWLDGNALNTAFAAIGKAKGFIPAKQICQEAVGLWRERSLIESLERILKFQERGDLAAIWNEANSAIAKSKMALANMVAATTEDSKL